MLMARLAVGAEARVLVVALALGLAATHAHATAVVAGPRAGSDPVPLQSATDRSYEDRILALDAEKISPADVRDVLAHAPAPRIISLQGSMALITMTPFAEYLIAMGYPESRLRDPRDGSLSRNSFADSEEIAGTLAWYYEREGMMPMLIGHSQGGMLAIRVLYELAGAFHAEIPVWNPMTGQPEQRTTIIDPLTRHERPVIGLKVPYVAALATGKLPRLLLGQWQMLGRLRSIPDTVEDFTGFSIEWDLIAGTVPGSESYHADGTAHVRNVTLAAETSHIRMPRARDLAVNPVTRAWIDGFDPGSPPAAPPQAPGVDASNIVHAADIWYSVKKHWCLEAQRLIGAQRAAIMGKGGTG
jgi:hypothetical protein